MISRTGERERERKKHGSFLACMASCPAKIRHDDALTSLCRDVCRDRGTFDFYVFGNKFQHEKCFSEVSSGRICAGFVHRAARVNLRTCTSCLKIESKVTRVLPRASVDSARMPQGRMTGYLFLLKPVMLLYFWRDSQDIF